MQSTLSNITMVRSIVVAAVSLVGVVAANVPKALPMIHPSGGIAVDSQLGRNLLSKARRAEGEEDRDVDFDFVADYSIKFQGCHHVTQWNEDADDEDEVRIKTKRLVRFRLCPSNSCQSDNTSGCTTKYGDYVVDMNTFVDAYLQALEDDADDICQDTYSDCVDKCGNDDEDCVQACFESYDMSKCLNDDGYYNDEIDPHDYTYCAQFNGINNYEYYLGPYCADQGGEIHLGLFTDNTCTTFASGGDSAFYDAMGYKIPYSSDSLISQRCMRCGELENNNNNNNEQNEEAEVKEVCQTVYEVSGKCESKMSVDYPNESACTYIEGIKIIREDGVIRTSQVKKSKAAAVCIGLFLTMAVLLAGYVMYLRTKLGRAKVNLTAAAGGTLA